MTWRAGRAGLGCLLGEKRGARGGEGNLGRPLFTEDSKEIRKKHNETAHREVSSRSDACPTKKKKWKTPGLNSGTRKSLENCLERRKLVAVPEGRAQSTIAGGNCSKKGAVR